MRGSNRCMRFVVALMAPLLLQPLSLSAANALKDEVPPLLNVEWQVFTWPLNSLYPIWDGVNSTNGRVGNACGPTAMANIIKYWGHPRFGAGSRNFVDSYARTWSADFAATELRYDRMPAVVTTQSTAEEIEAASQLMYLAAVSMMDPIFSGSRDAVLNGFTQYFRYSPSTWIANRDDYTAAEWTYLVKSELSAGRPLLVEGWSAINQDGSHDGHWFICDGYNAEGLFHIRWDLDLGNGHEAWLPLYGFAPYSLKNWIFVGLQPELSGSLQWMYPVGTELLQEGSTVTLLWDAEDVDTLRIELSRDRGFHWTTLATDVPASIGRYEWTVPQGEDSSFCQLRISKTGDPNVYACTSAVFSIYAEKSLVLESTSGWVVQPGALLPAHWSSTGVATVDLDYSSDGGYNWTRVGSCTATDGQCLWTVPDGNTNKALLRLTEEGKGGISSQSAYFVANSGNYPAAVRASDGDTVLLLHCDGDLSNASSLSGDGTAHGNVYYGDAATSPGLSLRVDNGTTGANCVSVASSANFALSGSWTIESWIKVHTAGGTYTAYPWALYIANSSGSFPVLIGLNAGTSKFTAMIYNSGGNTVNLGSVGSYVPGNWYHVALVANASAGTLSFYVHNADGSLQDSASTNVSAGNLTLYNSGGNLMLGGVPTGGNVQFDGWFDEIRIVRKALDLSGTIPAVSTPIVPVLTMSPVNDAVDFGERAGFSVAVAGPGPLTCQWYKDGSLLAEEVQTGLFRAAARPGDVGSYSVRVTNSTGSSALSTAATLVVSDHFASWQARYFSAAELLDAGISGPDADPDEDGVSNLMEFALGASPFEASRPGLEMVVPGDGRMYLRLRKPAMSMDVSLSVQVSVNLKDWSDAGVILGESDSEGGWETWGANWAVPVTSPVFYRLQANVIEVNPLSNHSR